MSPLRGGWSKDPWQLLDLQLLQHHPVVPVWNLNSQPPLFNVFCGLLLKLPYGIQEPVASLTFAGLGLLMVLSIFTVMVDLRIHRWMAFAIATLAIVFPACILYENWLSYAYPTASPLSVSALCLIRYIRTRQRWWGIGFFSALARVALRNSTYQLIWVLAVLVLVVLALRAQWRSVVTVAVVPLLVVVGWAAKDAARVGTLTTSSWIGMNLARTTLDTATPAELNELVKERTLGPLAEVPPFSPVSTSVPHFAKPVHGPVAVSKRYKSDMGTNFNNGIYADISR